MTSPKISTNDSSIKGQSALLRTPVRPHRTYMYGSVCFSHAPRIPPHGWSSRTQAGFSLIELMVVVALIAIIAGFSMTLSTSAVIRANASDERDFMVALLTEARARSLSNVRESAHGVYVDTINRMFLVYERRGGCTRATTSVIEIPFVSSSAIGGTLDRCFAPLSLRVPAGNAGTTTISLGGGTTTVNVNTVGRIDW